MRKFFMSLICLIVIILLIAGCNNDSDQEISSPKDEIKEVEEDVIALVNGEKVYIEEFNQFYETIKFTGIYEDQNEGKWSALKILLEDKVQEQKIIELGITASDDEAIERYNKSFKNKTSNFEEFIKESTVLEENDYLNSIKEGIKIDKLYEMNTIVGEKHLKPGEVIEVRITYVNSLINEAKIGVKEEYFDLVPKDFLVDKLKVTK